MTVSDKINKAELIIEEVNCYFGVDCRELTRKRDVIMARQMAMYYIKTFLKLSFKDVGSFFPSIKTKDGVKDHATVVHACKVVSGLIEVDKEVKSFDEYLKPNCYGLSIYTEKDYQKHLKIREINDNLQSLDLEELNLINDNIKNK